MQENINNIQFSDREWSVLKYLYHRDMMNAPKDDIETIALGLDIDPPLTLLIVTKLMNEGYVSRIVDSLGCDRYVLSLEGFELMKARKLSHDRKHNV